MMSESPDVLAVEVSRRCREKGVRLVLVEACTGGLVCARLTEVPGASSVVERGFIPYSNESKVEQLGVPLELLQVHGSVSAEAVEALAHAALEHSRADWAVAETGIAGPTGGTPLKPVGLAFLAVVRRGERAAVERHVFTGDRSDVRRAIADRAMALLLARLESES
ncbi:competence/damage-inducible protein CinA domain protein [Cystobacter fuscus DSM 2262]|uniref:Competence/damage-inducible protein CinA domain protein n=1 Tax=Cystobacter fuscus (strain ATCC 25194 / DSM 2262 / NBRC 100088 / M29) TaxID=1242864 RepID=S9P8T4_CYSF2|nr:CinA family protein [Cystobacter fuscus]EPX58652.1 competence/damage-inducible protein CinA domain protein [Cystobacter fuscus DSM 2262]